jgi:hypothetical protein
MVSGACSNLTRARSPFDMKLENSIEWHRAKLAATPALSEVVKVLSAPHDSTGTEVNNYTARRVREWYLARARNERSPSRDAASALKACAEVRFPEILKNGTAYEVQQAYKSLQMDIVAVIKRSITAGNEWEEILVELTRSALTTDTGNTRAVGVFRQTSIGDKVMQTMPCLHADVLMSKLDRVFCPMEDHGRDTMSHDGITSSGETRLMTRCHWLSKS